MQTEKIVIAGGTGFLGRALSRELVERGHDVAILTRSPQTGRTPREIFWDGKTPGEWTDALEGAAAVVNLAGRSVNCRHTPENLREIVESRIDSVNALGAGIARCKQPPRVWIQAGSLAIYGNTGERWCDETTPPGNDILAEVCVRWEETLNALNLPDTRRVVLRIGFVLGAGGGILSVLAKLARWYLGGRVGSGRQYISWIHLADMNRMFTEAIQNGNLSGVFNASTPEPLPNAEFMRLLRRAVHRPWSPPVPVWAARIGSLFMGTQASLALAGRRCMPRRFLEQGFEFRFSKLEPALADLFCEKNV